MATNFYTTFRTTTEVSRLITRTFPPLYRAVEAPRADGLTVPPELVCNINAATVGLDRLAAELKAWRATLTPSYTRTAKVDGWLRARADRIRSVLLGIEQAVTELAAYATEKNVNTWAYIHAARTALDAMWALDLEEDEAQEIKRMTARQDATTTLRPARPLLSARRKQFMERFEKMSNQEQNDCLQVLQLTLAKLVQAKKGRDDQATAEQDLAAPPATTPLGDAADLIEALDEALAGDGLGE